MAINLIPPKLQSSSIVAREIEANVKRAQTYKMLLNPNGYRRDLSGDPIDLPLAQQMLTQLANGYDCSFDFMREDFPIRAGTRIGLWCYSPWLYVVDPDCASGRFRLPQTAQDYLDHFAAATGIDHNCYALFEANFGVSITVIADEWINLTREQRLFVMSREYSAAVRRWPYLNKPSAFNRDNKKFGRPLVMAFILLSELERITLIEADMNYLNLLSCRKIRGWLDGSGTELANAIAKNHQLQRILEYQVLSTDVVTKVLAHACMNDIPVPAVEAFANPHLIVEEACKNSLMGKFTRRMIRAAFPDLEPNTRESTLSNDDPIRLYGLNNPTLGHAFIGQLGRLFRGGMRLTEERRAMLHAVILNHANHHLLKLPGNTTAKFGPIANMESTVGKGKNRQADAENYSKFWLPAAAHLGSAPRAKLESWLNPHSDKDLWRFFAGDDTLLAKLGLSQHERARTLSAVYELRHILNIQRLAAINNYQIAISVCCDLATSVSAVSTNRAFADGIKLLIQINKLYLAKNPKGK